LSWGPIVARVDAAVNFLPEFSNDTSTSKGYTLNSAHPSKRRNDFSFEIGYNPVMKSKPPSIDPNEAAAHAIG